MRGSNKLKAINDINKETQRLLLKSLLVYNAICFFLYWQKQKSFFLYFLLSPLELLASYCLFKLCKPKITKENGIDKLEHVVSINAAGPVSFCWDCLVWSMASKLMIVFGKGWFVLYLGIPISFFFEFLYKPYSKLKKQ